MRDVKALELRKIQVNSEVGARARLIRNKQATAMLEASVGINKIISGLKAGVPEDIILSDLEEISWFLRHSIHS